MMRRWLCAAAVSLAIAECAASARQSYPPATGPFKEIALDASYESGSPDGRLVLYHKAGAAGRVFVKDLATGAERVLIDVTGTVDHFVWSPDSGQLAYALAGSEKQVALQIVNVATGTERALGIGAPVGWTSNGIIVSTARDAWPGGYDSFVVASDGSRAGRVASYLNNIDPSPQVLGGFGSQGGLVVSEGQRIVIYDEATHTQRSITSKAQERGAVVSPDGQLLAFASNREGEWALYVVPLADAPVERPLQIGSLDGPLSNRATFWWTAGGRLALRAEYAGREIYKMAMSPVTGQRTGALQRLTDGAADHSRPMVSPDNRRIAFQYYRYDRLSEPIRVGLGIIDTEGRPEYLSAAFTRPPDAYAITMFPFAWHSPTDALVFRDDGTMRGFADVGLRAGAIQSMADPSTAIARRNFAFLAASNEVLFATGLYRTPGAELRAISLTTHETRTVAKAEQEGDFCATRDGRHVALFQHAAKGGALRLLSASGELESIILTTESGSLTPAAFSPDGHFLLYFDGHDAARVVNVETHESWALIQGDEQPAWSAGHADWSPDGSFIVLDGFGTWKDAHVRAWDGVTSAAVSKYLASSPGRVH